jgi:type IV secretory pathway TraG/TraD family ATPase VirD4
MKTILGTGIDIRGGKQQELYMNDADRSGHFWCFGTTRVGKTRLLENMLEQDIRKGNSVVVIDPKGDIPLFSKIYQAAKEAGREDDLMLITPIFPQYSIKLNPLEYYYMPEELVGHLISGIEVGSEPFFYNVAYETSLMIVQAFMLLTEKAYGKRFNFNDVKDVVSHTDLTTLQRNVASLSSDSHHVIQLANDLQKIVDSGQDYYNKVSSSLRVALMELTSGNIGEILGKARGNPVIEKLENGKSVILVAQVGSLMTRKAAFTVGKVLLSMFQSYVGRIFSSGQRVDPPLEIFMDEAQNVLYYGIDDFFAKAGGANVHLHGLSQSVNQIYAMIGRDYGNSTLDNINNKLFMKVPDEETASYVCRHFGTHKQMLSMMSSAGIINVRENEEDILKPEDVLGLQKREFFMMNYDGAFFGKTMDTSDAYINIEYPRATV